ncbi:ATP-binding cassette domain-containing protein [Nakamurella sp. YIM 132087]|uniref:ATP-binding cassette domain-containing protein n=1 Tax=Nakamurella alba TaxID=2665158 RepID=A0A7K1FSA0_9ACTN|nr:ABC transporter ATP-binding protein [Nakamurella alba]MTD17011.1 ATP-binding cassette domain-containing protein [Nakamurella alba]
MAVVEIEHLTRRYRGITALDDISLSVREHTITGLLGRNGAGKTTLMRILAGHEFRTSGRVSVFGEDPTENERVLRRMSVVREGQIYPDIKFKRVLEAGSWFHPHWDADFAAQLVDDFQLPLNRPVKKFSRGMMSAVGIVLGLASRAELTVFDEPYLGLDAVARQTFYDRLLADYAEHPRTVVLSTHLIDEVGDLLEDVLVIDHGRLVLAGSADDLRERAVTVSGPTAAVADVVGRRKVLHRQDLGGRSKVMVLGPFDREDRNRSRAADLVIEPVSLQQLVVRASGTGAEGGAGTGVAGDETKAVPA